MRSIHTPSATSAEEGLDRALDLLVRCVEAHARHLDQRQLPGDRCRRQRGDRGQLQELRRGRVVGADGGHDAELQIWPVVSGSATSKSSTGSPPPKGSSGPTLPSTWLPDGHVGEVDDQVGPLGEAHQQPVVVGRR